MNAHKQKVLIKRILIVRLSSIGDVARTLPALSSLRRQFPQAHIAWAVEDKSSGLLEGHPHLDEAILLERSRISKYLKNPLTLHRGLLKIVEFASRISGGKFDLVFDFHGLFKSGLITAFSRAPVRVGFTRPNVKEFNYLFTNRKVAPSEASLPRVERNLELVKPFVADGNFLDRPVLGLTSRHCEKAKAFIDGKLGDSHPRIAVHAGASRRLKQWSPHRFAELCDMLSDALNAKVVLTWGPGERKYVEEIHSLARTTPEIAPQTETLLELAAILHLCDLMIAVDSGPMHIGSLVGTPVVALFGPTDSRINAPYWQPNKVVAGRLPCRPCDEACEYAKCMEAITPAEVFQAAAELLETGKPRLKK
jgi:lipopolysaccharide heptosyltransferase I